MTFNGAQGVAVTHSENNALSFVDRHVSVMDGRTAKGACNFDVATIGISDFCLRTPAAASGHEKSLDDVCGDYTSKIAGLHRLREEITAVLRQ